jgi:hypothetical protein
MKIRRSAILAVLMTVQGLMAIGPCSSNRILLTCATCNQQITFMCPDAGPAQKAVYAHSIDLIECENRLTHCTKADGTSSSCWTTQVSIYICCDDGSFYPTFSNYICCGWGV